MCEGTHLCPACNTEVICVTNPCNEGRYLPWECEACQYWEEEQHKEFEREQRRKWEEEQYYLELQEYENRRGE